MDSDKSFFSSSRFIVVGALLVFLQAAAFIPIFEPSLLGLLDTRSAQALHDNILYILLYDYLIVACFVYVLKTQHDEFIIAQKSLSEIQIAREDVVSRLDGMFDSNEGLVTIRRFKSKTERDKFRSFVFQNVYSEETSRNNAILATNSDFIKEEEAYFREIFQLIAKENGPVYNYLILSKDAGKAKDDAKDRRDKIADAEGTQKSNDLAHKIHTRYLASDIGQDFLIVSDHIFVSFNLYSSAHAKMPREYYYFRSKNISDNYRAWHSRYWNDNNTQRLPVSASDHDAS